VAITKNMLNTKQKKVFFDVEDHGACRLYGSLCSVFGPSLMFTVLPFRKILRIYCVSINQPSYLELCPHSSSDGATGVLYRRLNITAASYSGKLPPSLLCSHLISTQSKLFAQKPRSPPVDGFTPYLVSSSSSSSCWFIMQ